MQFYLKETDAVSEEVKSSEAGLTSEEAAKRLEQNGKNKLAEAKKDSMLKRFVDQLKDPMIIILLVAAVIAAATEIFEAGKFVVPTDSIIILVVVLTMILTMVIPYLL